jgi:hypothetical protein
VSVKLGLDYQKDNTSASVSYERIQSTNNKAHSDGIEGANHHLGTCPSIPTLNLTAGGGDDIT